MEAANETFRKKGPVCLASDELNEADAMMEFCHALNIEYPACGLGRADLRGFRRLLQRVSGHVLLTSMPDILLDCCGITPM